MLVKENRVCGVKTKLGLEIASKTIILTTGTFLKGTLHIGHQNFPGGRMGDFSSYPLVDSLQKLQFPLGILKTGTPARILGKSINFSVCDEQPSDEKPCFFAFYDTRTEEKEQ